jgi:nucleotide-binding universal stress UspA family protein
MNGCIIVPLDGSRFGEHALPYALSIATKAGVPIHLVHVHETPAPVYSSELAILEGPLDPEMRARKEEYLDKLVKEMRSRTTVPVKFILHEGAAVESLVDYLQQVSAGMIVMTTHGRGTLGRFWLGSVADRLIRRAPIPVFLVHGSKEPVDLNKPIALKKMLAPLDGSPLAEQVLQPALDLAGLLDSQCELFRASQEMMALDFYPPFIPAEAVDPKPREQLQKLTAKERSIAEELRNDAERYLERVASRLRSQGKTVETVARDSFSPADGILEEVQKGKADWIALATHGRKGLPRLMLGSVADKVIRGATVPVLVYRPIETK